MSSVLWEQEMSSVLSSFYLLPYCQYFFTSIQCAYKLDNHNSSLYRKIKAIKMSCLDIPTKFKNKSQLMVCTYGSCKEMPIKHGRFQWPKRSQLAWLKFHVKTGIHGMKHLLPN